jgi:aminopeptidase N
MRGDTVFHYLKSTIKITIFSVFLVSFSSCSLLGISFQPHNPARAGKYPARTEKLDLLANQDSRFRTCYDVKRYELGITPDPEKKTISGVSIITSLALKDIDTFQLDLDQRLELKDLKLNDIPVKYYRRYSAVFVITPNTIKAKTRFVIKGTFTGKPQSAKKPPWKGGLVWKEDKNGKYWCGVACETEGASLWWLCKDVTNDEADTTIMHYSSVQGLMMVGNGKLASKLDKGGSVVYTWQVNKPINTYDITFYLGDFVLIQDSFFSISGKWVPIRHYVLRDHEQLARTHFKQAKKILSEYENYFGEYPWQEEGYRLVESPYEGMEHQSAIAYGNGYSNKSEGIDYIILHETAHEWWGNAVSAGDLADVWLQEGFATFSEYLYYKYSKDADARQMFMAYWISIRNKRPLVAPYNLRYFYYKDGDVYTKGAFALLSLRFVLHDDSLFMKVLRTFYDKNKMKPGGSSTKDFENTIHEVTGKDLSWFYKQYFYSRKVPVLEFRIIENKGIIYRWTACDSSFVMPVKVKYNEDEYMLYPGKEARFTAIPGITAFKTKGLFWIIRQNFFISVFDSYFGLKPSRKLKAEIN